MQTKDSEAMNQTGEKSSQPAEGEPMSDQDIEGQLESSGMKHLSPEKERQPMKAQEEGDSVPDSTDEASDDADRDQQAA